MIEREVLQDITKYKAKLIGPFTGRQAIFFTVSAVIAIPVYLFLKQYFVKTFALAIPCIVVSPLLLCGFYEPYGMHFEKYAMTIFKTKIISPTIRKVNEKNAYYEQLKEFNIEYDNLNSDIDKSNKKKSKKAKKCKEKIEKGSIDEPLF